jgi:hypothetical protein
MGRQDAGAERQDAASLRAFTRKLLADLRALESMLASGAIERGVRRIGAEQELFLLDRDYRPAPLAVEMMEKLAEDGHFTTEVAPQPRVRRIRWSSEAAACAPWRRSWPSCSPRRGAPPTSSTARW